MTRACIDNKSQDTWRRSALLKAACACLAIVTVTAAIRLPLLGIPFERDEGEYAYIAWRLGFGELPYLHWFDQKPPAIFWIYRLALGLPMDATSAAHLLAMFFACGSAFCVYLICSRLQGHGWGLVAGLTYAVFAADPLIQGTAANTEVFMLLPLLVSHVLFLRAVQDGRGGKLAMLQMGVLNGIAVACKQVALVNILFMFVAYPAMIGIKGRLRKTGVFVLVFTLGFLICWGGIVLYFASRHALDALIANVFTHNLLYVQAIPFARRIQYFIQTATTLAGSQLLLWLFALVGAAGTISLGRPAVIYILGWALTSMVGISAGGYYFPHYFQQGLPVLVIFAVLGTKTLSGWRLRQERPLRKQAVCISLLFLLPAVALYPFLTHYSHHEAARKIYSRSYFAEAPAISAALARVTGPDDRIFIFGAEPQLFFYTRRASATRYIFLFPLYGPYHNALQRQLQAANEITASKPEIVLYSPNQLFFVTGSHQYFTAWTKQFLGSNYNEWAHLTSSPGGMVSMTYVADGVAPEIAAGDALVGILFRKKASTDHLPVENLASAR